MPLTQLGDRTGYSPCITSNTPDYADLQDEFRALITLLIRVTAINNGGRSTLRQEAYTALFDTILLDPSNVLNAVAAILVRDYRMVAAVASDSVPRGSDLNVYVMQDVEPQFNDKEHGITVLAAIANTDTMDGFQTSNNRSLRRANPTLA